MLLYIYIYYIYVIYIYVYIYIYIFIAIICIYVYGCTDIFRETKEGICQNIFDMGLLLIPHLYLYLDLFI